MKRKLRNPDDDSGHVDIGAFPDPPVEDCPVTFLGAYDGRVVFAMPDGQIRDERAADIMRLLRTDIFRCVAGQKFLNNWCDPDGKINRELAAVWFNRQCTAAGFWDKSRPQRSLGVWPAGNGDVILHRGHELWRIDPAGKVKVITIAEAMRDRSLTDIYQLRPTTPAPTSASSAGDGRKVRQALDMWRFEPIGDDGLTGADLVAGWLMAGLMGAVAPFRPHLLVFAMAGSGKTTLLRYVHGLASALAGGVIDSFTRAGFASGLAGMARPVLIDEAEGTAGGVIGAIEQSIELMRRMATGEGAVRKMGDLAGGTVTQTAIGAVMMVAINPVRLAAADASRIAEARLLPLDQASAPGEPQHKLVSRAELEKTIDWAKALAPALLARALFNVERYKADVAILTAAFVKHGQSPRSADLIAALAAGRHLLVCDEPLDADQAEAEARFWASLLDQREQTEVVANIGEDCLAHLFHWKSGQHATDRILSLGEIILKAADYDDTKGRNTVLAEFGLKVRHQRDPEDGQLYPWLIVSNRHPGLVMVFERTPWRDWRKSLGFIDSMGTAYKTLPSKTSVRFGVIVGKALCIPLRPWLVTDGHNRLRAVPAQAFDGAEEIDDVTM